MNLTRKRYFTLQMRMKYLKPSILVINTVKYCLAFYWYRSRWINFDSALADISQNLINNYLNNNCYVQIHPNQLKTGQ